MNSCLVDFVILLYLVCLVNRAVSNLALLYLSCEKNIKEIIQIILFNILCYDKYAS